ncbi:PAS domain-containing sensor histidine kinase [Paraburkholderia kirstenboschensis]|uniref:PAS domain-containing sensor histidine kinase n=1 Tax=Paraburkholderia kirstenboschensis TaxID=1245436 RepID=UPI0024366F16|nr:PAS domain S-box protein [Paraburkholderia kirstenboschensis]
MDVTGRKVHEQSHGESEARFSAMADSAPVMIWMSDRAGLCIFFNKPWLSFTGRTHDQEVGHGWSEGVHPEDLERCLDVYVTSFDARKDFTMEYRLRRRDGQYRWILDTGVPNVGADGAFLGYIGSCIDITDRRQVEDKFRSALEFLPVAILMVDQQGRIALANEQTGKLFGYRLDELGGQPATMLVPQLLVGSDCALQTEVSRVEQSGTVATSDLMARRKDGTEFLIEAGLNTLRFEDELATLAVIVDRTERLELHRNQQELAHLTRISTIGELATSLAHEIIQPLTAIRNNAEAAQRFIAMDPVDLDEMREALRDIVEADERASEVIRRIRALVRKGEREVAPLKPATVVRDVLLLLRSDAIARGVRMSLHVDGNVPEVFGDRVQLQQVLLNLLLNAFDAMNDLPASSRMVTVVVTVESPLVVRVAVRDCGTGLPSGERSGMIFKPFFSSKRDGLGLGLSISRSIIELHGGRLWAENNPERGATFCFTLPAVEPAHQSSGKPDR